nr:MAG TPA: hypothetical protein [Inoviridae sp.]
MFFFSFGFSVNAQQIYVVEEDTSPILFSASPMAVSSTASSTEYYLDGENNYVYSSPYIEMLYDVGTSTSYPMRKYSVPCTFGGVSDIEGVNREVYPQFAIGYSFYEEPKLKQNYEYRYYLEVSVHDSDSDSFTWPIKEVQFYNSRNPRTKIVVPAENYTFSGNKFTLDYEFIAPKNSNVGCLKVFVLLNAPKGLEYKNVTFDSVSSSLEFCGDGSPDKGFWSNLMSGLIGKITSIFNAITELPGNIANYFSGFFDNIFSWFSKVWESIKAIPQLIIDGIKSLFVPSDGYFDDYWEKMNSFFSAKFGGIYYPIEFIITFLNRAMDIPNSNPKLVLVNPVKVFGHTLIEPFEYNFDILEADGFNVIYQLYLMAADFLLCFAVFKLLVRKYEEVFRI